MAITRRGKLRAVIAVAVAVAAGCSMAGVFGPHPEKVILPDDGRFEVTAKVSRLPATFESSFLVHVQVKNVSGSPQTIHVWNCSRNHNWKTDNPQVGVSLRNCWKNFIEPVVLQVGESYETDLDLFARSGKAEHNFRMGFTSSDENRRTYWSNELVVRPEPVGPPAKPTVEPH